MKALIIAIGHPDNVFSLAYHLSDKIDLTVLYLVAGERSQRGILDLDIMTLENGYHESNEKLQQVFPESILNFVNRKFKLHVFKIPSFKVSSLDGIIHMFRLSRKIRKEKYDVVHYNGASGFIYPLYLLTKKFSKQFWTLHDFKSHSGEENTKAERINRFIAGRKSMKLVQHYNYLKGAITKEYNLMPNKIHVLYSGPLTVFRSYLPTNRLVPNKKYVLFFGRISKYKGVDHLIKAFQNIQNPEFDLVIAGKGEINEPVSSDNIIVYNKYIPTEDLIGLIQNSEFVVAPYRDATHSAVIATAYEFNKPVVASDVMGLKEVVSNNKTGLLIDPLSIEDLKNKLVMLMDNPAIIKDFEENITAELKTGLLSWDKITNEYVKLYKETE